MWPESEGFATTSDVVPINLRIAKARDGATRGDIKLDFHHRCYRFVDVTSTPPAGRSTQSPMSGSQSGATIDPYAE
jgi:hypothetical protein